MFSPTNIEDKLFKARSKRISSQDILEEVQKIFEENQKERNRIEQNLHATDGKEISLLDIDLLEADRLYHLSDIKKLCIVYRLRFLDSRFFKPAFPEETLTAIHELERTHSTKIESFKIMAPAKLLKLENADDPLLFTPLGNDYFYLVHKWGKDLHPFRKLLMWPYKTLENLIATVILVSLLFTFISITCFIPQASISEYVLTFLFLFKLFGGIVIYYGFAKGKNFNEAVWKSRFYNA